MNLKLPIIICIFLFTIIGCKNVIEQPKVEVSGLAKVTFDHQNFTDGCTQCHQKDTPKMKTNKVLHGGGNDCKLCHESTSWKNARYEHTPVPLECKSCHADKQPAPVNGILHWGGLDCKGCHSTSNKNWKKSIYVHPKDQKKCFICHAKDKPYAFHGMNSECRYCHKTDEGGW